TQGFASEEDALMATKHIVDLAQVPLDKINAPEGSPFGGARRRVGAHIGAQKLGYSFFYVPPGKAAFPLHSHSRNEEMIHYRRRGRVALRPGGDCREAGNDRRLSGRRGIPAPA